ncbi:diguanylate cyclase (GGDEF)-like protein/PAS domain S-box-containing protein [Okibacterium sp. HSC-33S16]|uniref:diguanylate cyclase n=1 Tax=Okibacterium sp. HSC-33S16 TaxID=2910965 RepID=UPI00209DC732|nr:diguanylate cyclase [Okibacterium sp. HSC-33S16]MCP2032197.1 diguanylate cyclase (GGDEF)-like protein/PAS domain S-box-containing protein [Okibacterium sp. HSC-33S16]
MTAVTDDGHADPVPVDPPSDYVDLYENAPCGYVVTSFDGTITSVNETFTRMVGYSRSDLIGRNFQSLLTVGSQLFHETRFLPVLHLRKRVDEIALKLRCADDSTLPTLVNGVQSGVSGEVRIALFDSTERTDYEQELLAARRAAEISEAQVGILQRASTAFTLADTEAALTAALAESVREAFAASFTAILLYDDHGVLQLATGTHPLLEYIQAGWDTPSTRAVDRNDVVIVGSLEEAEKEFPKLAPVYRANQLEACIASPLTDKGKAVGVISSFFRRKRDFDPALLELLATLTQQASHVLARIRLQSQLARMALHDLLTGLANRQLLQARLDQAIAAAERSGRPLAVIFLDLDGFKVVNDSCGHAVGDSVLQQVADRLRASVRSADTIGRYGGDEFVVICEDSDADAVSHVADRILAAVKEPLVDVPDEYPVSASIGVALLVPEANPSVTTDGMLGLADAAMYQSKNAGKDRVTVVLV